MPREIRNIIYKELVYIPNLIPLSPSDPGPRFSARTAGTYHVLQLSSERFPAHSHLNLLLCNRQLYAEFQEFLTSSHGTLEYAKVDCMIIKKKIWPTWSIFPAGRDPKVRNLDVDLRTWDPENLYLDNDRLRHGAQLLVKIVLMAFEHFLDCLLKWGPRLTHSGDKMPIDTISVRILLQSSTPLVEELGDFDADYHLSKIGCILVDHFGAETIRKSLIQSLVGRVARLKLIYGNMSHEIVVGDGKSVIDTPGAWMHPCSWARSTRRILIPAFRNWQYSILLRHSRK